MRFVLGFVGCCGRNCERENCYACLVKSSSSEKRGFDSESINLLIERFYRQT